MLAKQHYNGDTGFSKYHKMMAAKKDEFDWLSDGS